MICYNRLWATMEAKGVTQYKLIKQYNFSAGQIGRLKKNMHVSTHTLDTLCAILNCEIYDIVEYIPEDKTEKMSVSPGRPLPDTPASLDADKPSLPDARKTARPAVSASAKKTGAQAASSGQSLSPEVKKTVSSKSEKVKKSGKSKKGDKKASKESKKSKDSKKNKQ